MRTLKIDSGEIGFREIDTAKIGFVTGFAGGFDPDAMLVENFSELEDGDGREGVFRGIFGRFVERVIVVL